MSSQKNNNTGALRLHPAKAKSGNRNNALIHRGYKVLVAEDDITLKELIAGYLSKRAGFEDVQFVDNGKTAFEMMSDREFDLVIMDIILPELDGLAVVELALGKGLHIPCLIFLSDYSHYAVRAFELNAVDYLLKPITFERFNMALDRFERIFGVVNTSYLNSQYSTFNIVTRSKSHYIKFNEIIYISSSSKQSVIHCVNYDLEIPRLIGELEAELPADLFIRNHNRYLVNKNYIQILKIINRSYFLKLQDMDDTILPVGRKYIKKIKLLFKGIKNSNGITRSYPESHNGHIININNIKVLLVMNDALTSVMTATLLKNFGYIVEVVSKRKDALSIMSNRHIPIDIVLMDLDSSDNINGVKAAKEIKKTRDIPVVILTSHLEKNIIEKSDIIFEFGYAARDSGYIALLNSIIMALKLHTAKKMIRDKSAILRSLFDLSPVGSGLLVNRMFVIVNESLCDMTGYSREELVGHTARIIYPDEDEYRRVELELYSKLENSRTGMMLSTLKTKEGNTFDVSLCLGRIDNNDLSKGVTLTVMYYPGYERIE